MRITFVCPFLGLAGGIRVIAIHAQSLVARGHEVTVVSTPLAQPRLKSRLGALARGRGWPVNRGVRGPYFAPFGGRLIELDRHRPVVDADLPDADVVVATWWETAEWVNGLSASKGAKAYFIQHYEAHPGQPKERVDATWLMPMHRIVVSRWLADLGERRFGVERPTLVANGVDVAQFSSPERAMQRVPTVGVMYSTIPYKGLDVSLQAVRIARERVPDLRLVAFGAMEPTADLPLPERTEFHLRPGQDLIPMLYGACDAWLFASRTEGFGLPLLEAMACRTPVIGTPSGAAPELIERGGGVLVRPDDPADMASAIERVAGMGDESWRAMSDAAYRTASTHTWAEATGRFERALEAAVLKADSGVDARSANHRAPRVSAA